jgi:pimeloyl-ACP methyl ester carboxylesterase
VLSAFAGGRMMGVRHGSTPARVVALHGWSRAHGDFDSVLAGLDAAAPDLPGFGATAPPPTPWGAADYAAVVAALLEEQQLGTVLVGHSFGGRVAVVLAAERPELVSALVLSGVPLLRLPDEPEPRTALSFRLAKKLQRIGLVSDARMEARKRRSGSRDYQNAGGVMRDVLVRAVSETADGTYTRALARVSCPIEMVWGEDDTVAPPSVARSARTVAPSAHLCVVPGVGHLVPLEDPSALRAAIERHLLMP